MKPGSRAYYTLVSSLPPLPHFERAERLPISPYRLEQRLSMLDAEDAGQLVRARQLIGWRPERPLRKGDEETARQYRKIMEQPFHPALAEFIEFRMDQQTVMSALRRRRSRIGLPSTGRKWGAGRWVRWIENHWDDPDFRFGSVVPWVQEVRGYLEAAEAVSMERLLMDLAWQRLNRIGDRDLFGFEAVMAYVFKWDILKNRLDQDADAGKKHFQKLVEEVMHG
ncbi:MAG: DUF2764 domain-containing protein [Deltaproteobacteria bacterium HGW-Deltaproteobacteria-15]|jgi:hypothetical protein|nr:MAG: DUF2764 domain-containing protein [Deltaproteobacteria bacterium HGW-Deltaproteobacteria-15]